MSKSNGILISLLDGRRGVVQRATLCGNPGAFQGSKETNSTVDIGYQYVAADIYGNSIDTTSDGIPDYLKDFNGDGVYGAGDVGNWLIGRFNGLSSANGLSVFPPLR